jgi:hypothetical protein
MKINNKYNIEDRVYIITDPDQNLGMIDAITVFPNGLLSYSVSVGGESYDCYEINLSKEKNILIGIEKTEE